LGEQRFGPSKSWHIALAGLWPGVKLILKWQALKASYLGFLYDWILILPSSTILKLARLSMAGRWL
jgi:hypothetical protein